MVERRGFIEADLGVGVLEDLRQKFKESGTDLMIEYFVLRGRNHAIAVLDYEWQR